MAELPARFAGLRMYGGLPVPVTVMWTDGRPDFRVIDTESLAHCLARKLCAVCGKKLDYWIAFVGGPKSVASRYFLDGPMHEECARWSMATCPFLVGKQDAYSDKSKRPIKVPDGASVAHYKLPDERPDRMGMLLTRTYDVVGGDKLVIRAGKAKEVVWFE